ncbi:hypothetical protein CGC48_06880 [Capnocytophaga cynodegmi]|uniref:Uncharacterized protein n=1 Tax=Capnocytophaga cynodegmi TaxID=28189 RepID=A0A250E626_9FLAO|nr:hypothetical protein [Capnocytophaga cynodegmi]ATA68373.1 hypothetical protein CGC48_06880 [Capnocytophaga cynodegmi]
MNTLRQELRPDWATTEKLYPLILKRLQDYETFWDAQPDDTPEAVFDAEYKAMEVYLSELTGKDLSETWLWEWWESNGIEVFAFDLAMPEAQKHDNLTRDDLQAFVTIIRNNEFECENQFQEQFMPYMFYSHNYFRQFLELNFKRYKPDFFNSQKDKNGNWHELSIEEIVAKIWK